MWLQTNYEVSQVVLTNRQECCRCPLAGANIYIGNPSNLNIIATDNPDLSKESTWQLCATVRPLQALFIVADVPKCRPVSCQALASENLLSSICKVLFAANDCLSPLPSVMSCPLPFKTSTFFCRACTPVF